MAYSDRLHQQSWSTLPGNRGGRARLISRATSGRTLLPYCCVFLFIGCLGLGGLHSLGAQTAPTAESAPKITQIEDLARLRQRYPPARQCRDCHPDHFKAWNVSFHARSLSTEGFLKGFARFVASMENQNRRGRDVYMACFNCHAPLLNAVEDQAVHDVAHLVLTRKVHELEALGVDCVACHRGEGERFYGPIQDPVTNPFHESAYSQAYESSQVCAGCHTWSPPAVACSTVYTDWKHSQAAGEGRACQSCHMAEQSGVAASIGPRRKIHDHAFPGGRSADLLGRSVTLGLDATFGPDQLIVMVSITNLAAHRLPDG